MSYAFYTYKVGMINTSLISSRIVGRIKREMRYEILLWHILIIQEINPSSQQAIFKYIRKANVNIMFFVLVGWVSNKFWNLSGFSLQIFFLFTGSAHMLGSYFSSCFSVLTPDSGMAPPSSSPGIAPSLTQGLLWSPRRRREQYQDWQLSTINNHFNPSLIGPNQVMWS
jgi:hypothetical protein